MALKALIQFTAAAAFGLMPGIGFAEGMDKSDAEIGPDLAKAIEASVGEQLKDPSSAQYKGFRTWEMDSGSICGYVNAKNSFGGYVGFIPFRYEKERGIAFLNAGNGCK